MTSRIDIDKLLNEYFWKDYVNSAWVLGQLGVADRLGHTAASLQTCGHSEGLSYIAYNEVRNASRLDDRIAGIKAKAHSCLDCIASLLEEIQSPETFSHICESRVMDGQTGLSLQGLCDVYGILS